MEFEWDSDKVTANARKHGVAFEEAQTVFDDELTLTGYDPDHSIEEDRYITMGVSIDGRLLIVSHTDRDGRIRIISARVASNRERKDYEDGNSP